MRVRTHLQLWRASRSLSPLLVAAAISAPVAVHGGPAQALAVAVMVMWATRRLHPRLESWARRRLLFQKNRELARAADPRRVYEDIAEGYRLLKVPPDTYLQITSAYILLQEFRWADARAELSAIDRAGLAPSDAVTCDNNLAWAMAHDGAAGEAVTLAEEVRDRARSLDVPPEQLAMFDGTLGAALTLAGRHQAALEPLERALATGGDARAQAIRHYYLGCALSSLQRLDEARRHWQAACDALPGSRWAALAGEKLKAHPSAYR